ncbi:MAG TPA: hypothetical protein ENH60_08520 [Pricia sp.]|uniref:Lipocalin-like domain-containing protein n=1 Tax=Pricia antarctica TaxID=641691 RepID=A0A831QSW4_9FLAO|nr:hypothetical protein [Pricia sp.]HEA22544.1 hypothetical protein [Pricia antarctica]
MYRLLVLVCILICSGCSGTVSTDDLAKLNGYWEIERVVFPDGNTKDYNINTTVDYIEWDGSDGFRKKMSPKFDGTYETSDDAEAFTIIEKDGLFTINYKTELSKWSEKLLAIDDESFSVVNEAGLQYDYQRFEPISIKE